MSKLNIFFTGATGYIGGSVLARLLEHKNAANFNITVLVRSEAKAKLLEKDFGLKAVVGSHRDAPLVEELASQADIVFTMADCDDMVAAAATLTGMKKYFEQTGKQAILIHTSGTGLLTVDKAEGNYTSDVVYDDLDADQIETLPDSQQHRNVDLLLLEADKEGYVRVNIVAPSIIYGSTHNKLIDAGIQNPRSILIPVYTRAAFDLREVGLVGQGINYWPNVHIDDVADLYIIVFDAILEDPSSVAHGRHGFFFGDNGEHQMIEVGQAIGEALVEFGLSATSKPRPFTKEEIDKYLGGSSIFGSNSRCKSNHGRKLGWKPKYTKADLLASVKPEVELLAKQAGLL